MTAVARTMVLILIASLMTLAPAAPSAACAEELSLDNYRIKVDIDKQAYSYGEVAHFSIRVVQKTTKEPVEDAYTGVGIARRDSYAYAVGTTNKRGREHLKVAIRRYLRPGYVTLQAYAYKRHADLVGCVAASEYGYKKIERAFRIRG